jgi:hypothetical protein
MKLLKADSKHWKEIEREKLKVAKAYNKRVEEK